VAACIVDLCKVEVRIETLYHMNSVKCKEKKIFSFIFH
jgi:hypothetical protein